jgi:hypothetical protein
MVVFPICQQHRSSRCRSGLLDGHQALYLPYCGDRGRQALTTAQKARANLQPQIKWSGLIIHPAEVTHRFLDDILAVED